MTNRLRRASSVGFLVALGALLGLLPLVGLSPYATTIGYQLLLWTTLAVSWNLFSGFAGYPSFGHGVFFGIGIYTASTLITRTDWPFLLTLAASGITAGLIALLVGSVAFLSPRFKGDLFALVTLVLAFVVATVVSNTALLDGGAGVFVRESAGGTLMANSPTRLYVTVAFIGTITVVTAYVIASGRWGAAFTAIRDDEEVAEASGIPTYRYKVGGFCLSAGLAGLIGAPHAVLLGYVEVGSVFTLSIPLFVLMMAILGGTTTWYGPIIGAVLVTSIRQFLIGQGQAEVSQIIVGLVLVALILLWPGGLGALLQRRVATKAASS